MPPGSGDAEESLPPPIDTEEAARRLARVIVSDIQLYNGAQIAAGQDISLQIKEGFHHFVGRVAPELHQVFHTVLAERGLGGAKAPVPASAPPQAVLVAPLAPMARPDSPTPVALPAGDRTSHTPHPEASARRWDEGAGPERVTPKVLSVTPPLPIHVADDDAEDGFSDAPTAVSAPPPAVLQKSAPPAVHKPTPIPTSPPEAAPGAFSTGPAPSAATRAAPPSQRAASEPTTPPPLPVAAMPRPRAVVPAASQPAPLPPAPISFPASTSSPMAWPSLDAAPNPPPQVSPFGAAMQASQPSAALQPAADNFLAGSADGPVPNLKPPFPWVKLILFVGAVVAAVGALMVMVTR